MIYIETLVNMIESILTKEAANNKIMLMLDSYEMLIKGLF